MLVALFVHTCLPREVGDAVVSCARLTELRLDPTLVVVLIANPQDATLYFGQSTAALHSRLYEQVFYVWLYPQSAGGRRGRLVAQGVRMTLDSRGLPAVWEVMANDTSAKIIYVSRVVEHAAAEEFGPPLAGRRFSVETGLSSFPDVVVARVVVSGEKARRPAVVRYGVLDYYDAARGISAMMRTTGFSLSITGQMQVSGQAGDPGFRTAYEAVPAGPYIRALRERGIDIDVQEEAV